MKVEGKGISMEGKSVVSGRETEKAWDGVTVGKENVIGHEIMQESETRIWGVFTRVLKLPKVMRQQLQWMKGNDQEDYTWQKWRPEERI